MPVFYCPDLTPKEFTLDEEESRHCVKVLRKQIGDQIEVTNGMGLLKTGRITSAQAKKVTCVTVREQQTPRRKPHYIHLVISPTKNMDRMEWLVEKAGELDADAISFIFCDHSERKVLKTERLKKKALGAMKQSGGFYLTEVREPFRFKDLEKVLHLPDYDDMYIAHLEEGERTSLQNAAAAGRKSLILVGPEGDFSPGEIKQAISLGIRPVTLGTKTLRTETAGLIACHSFNFLNGY